MKKWQEIFSDADRALLQRFGGDERQAFGKNPALIIVDVVKSFIGSKPAAALEAAEEFRTSCGSVGWDALSHIKKLLEAFRGKDLPIVFTTIDPVLASHAWGPDKRMGPVELSHEKWSGDAWEIPDEIKPRKSEVVIRKTKASGFLFTPLAPILHNKSVDCLVVVGTSTSGCVRATVIDGLSYKYNVFVVEECTFDRFELSHLVALWDMNSKYADVITLVEALNYLSGIK